MRVSSGVAIVLCLAGGDALAADDPKPIDLRVDRAARGPRGPRGAPGPRGPAGPQGGPGAAITPLATGVQAVTVNRTYAIKVKQDGASFARLRLFPNAASVGTFYGPGAGNKGMLGFTGHAGTPVAALESIRFASRVPASSPRNANVYLNLIVDLACDSRDPEYAIVVADQTLAEVGPQGQWNEYAIAADEPLFKSVGAVAGLPSHLANEGLPLSALTALHPEACLVNADPYDNGMPKHTKLPAILVLGDSNTTAPLRVDLDAITIETSTSAKSYGF